MAPAPWAVGTTVSVTAGSCCIGRGCYLCRGRNPKPRDALPSVARAWAAQRPGYAGVTGASASAPWTASGFARLTPACEPLSPGLSWLCCLGRLRTLASLSTPRPPAFLSIGVTSLLGSRLILSSPWQRLPPFHAVTVDLGHLPQTPDRHIARWAGSPSHCSPRKKIGCESLGRDLGFLEDAFHMALEATCKCQATI